MESRNIGRWDKLFLLCIHPVAFNLIIKVSNHYFFCISDQPKRIAFTKTVEWRYRKAVPTAILYSPSRRLLENNSLRIQCQTRLIGNKQERVYSGGAAVRSLAEEEKAVKKNHALALDMGKALKNSVFTDIEIQAVDGVFEAHRAVLAGLWDL